MRLLWKTTCRSTDIGGLGVRSISDIAAAAIQKKAWFILVVENPFGLNGRPGNTFVATSFGILRFIVTALRDGIKF